MQPAKVVSQEEWLAARRALLAKEKAHMREGDALAAERRALPWVKVDKTYVFDTAAGPKTLAELFDGRGQLIVHHLMYAPDWAAACPGCTFQAEHIDGPAPHLEWVSSAGDFNRDYRVTFTEDQIAQGRVDYNFGTIQTDPRYIDKELPGVSVFSKNDAGEVFHTYSTYARGLDALLGTNHYLDITPEGRNDEAHPNWPRRRDEYGAAGPSHG